MTQPSVHLKTMLISSEYHQLQWRSAFIEAIFIFCLQLTSLMSFQTNFKQNSCKSSSYYCLRNVNKCRDAPTPSPQWLNRTYVLKFLFICVKKSCGSYGWYSHSSVLGGARKYGDRFLRIVKLSGDCFP